MAFEGMNESQLDWRVEEGKERGLQCKGPVCQTAPPSVCMVAAGGLERGGSPVLL